MDPHDPYERALEKLKVVRHANRLEFNLERRAKIEKRIRNDLLKESVYLPASVYQEFLTWLKGRRLWDVVPQKTDSHLRAMRKCVLDVNLDPSLWPEKPEKIYQWFLKKRYSLSYIDKVLPLLNDYGYFYCREFKKAFVPIPTPTGDIARKIDDANLDDRDGDGAASLPILPEHLHILAAWPPEKLRWLRYTVYFGLRPSEVDALIPKNQGKIWKVYKDSNGKWVLAFYQKKLVRIERERRWKRIPAILPEQEELLAELVSGSPVKRPVAKTLEKYLGEGHYLYGGRKGFEKLMRERGQSFVNISRWLGHRDIKRTETNYREAELVEYDPV